MTELEKSDRLPSVDFLRGLVMVLMAIDHVRVYSGLPPGGPDAGIFFTRWVTHFCAPAFVFLSGTSAFLYGAKLGNPAKLARYLIARGLLLVVLELTVIRFFWTFNFNFSSFALAGVIWMLGWCMVLLGCMVKLSARTIGIIGLVIIFFQNIFGYVPSLFPEGMRASIGYFWEFIYTSGFEGPPSITILYVIVPWIGVMAAGYGFGMILQTDPATRKRSLVRIGWTATFSFLILGSLKIFIEAKPDSPPFLFNLLSQQKYPASQLFLLMTLGPSILVIAYVEKVTSFFSKAIITFGRVPFFYYLLHILFIHISALVVQWITEGHLTKEFYDTAPYTWMPEERRWSLGMLYLVFIVDVILLYFSCWWYEKFKRSHAGIKWLKFL